MQELSIFLHAIFEENFPLKEERVNNNFYHFSERFNHSNKIVVNKKKVIEKKFPKSSPHGLIR